METQRDSSDSGAATLHSSGSSVGELVKRINDGPAADSRDKRGRSESGDALPAGKRGGGPRGEFGRSPGQNSESVRERVDIALQDFESRILSSISKDLHELRDTIHARLDLFETRIKDLENHVEERDSEVENLKKELGEARREMQGLKERAEDAEIHSRRPCLILSGDALAPARESARPGSLPADAGRRAPGAASAVTSGGPGAGGRQAGGEGSTTSADRRMTSAEALTAESADRQPAAAAAGPGSGGGRRGTGAGGGGGRGGEGEDINQLVVSTLNRCLPGLNMSDADIDSAHRLPGRGHRVIVRFTRSGKGSIRDQVYWRRLSLKGRELFVSESLTKLRGAIFRSLLSAKKENKIHTVFTRGGQVLFKWREFGTPERVDSLEKVRQLGFPVVEIPSDSQ